MTNKPIDLTWIVNDLAELGVKIGDRYLFLYKGESIEYEDGKHDDGTPILWRPVGKREFGETCKPLKAITDSLQGKDTITGRYAVCLKSNPSLDHAREDGRFDWKPCQARQK